MLMSYRHNQGIHILDIIHGLECNPVEALGLRGIGRRVNHNGNNPIFPKFPINIYHFCVSGIRAVFLESKAQDRHFRMFHRNIRFDQIFDQALRHILAHIVVDPSAGKNNLGVITQFFRLISQVIGIHADTVAAHQTRHKF